MQNNDENRLAHFRNRYCHRYSGKHNMKRIYGWRPTIKSWRNGGDNCWIRQTFKYKETLPPTDVDIKKLDKLSLHMMAEYRSAVGSFVLSQSTRVMKQRTGRHFDPVSYTHLTLPTKRIV